MTQPEIVVEGVPALPGVSTRPKPQTTVGGAAKRASGATTRKPTPAQTRRCIKALIDLTAGYKIDRRAELEAVITVASCSLPALGRAFVKLPLRDDDHLRIGAVIARIAQPGFVERAKTELAALDNG